MPNYLGIGDNAMPTYEERECSKHGKVRFVLEGRGYFRCTKCRMYQVSKRRDQLKQKAVEYKGGKCEKCEYNKCIAALEFHHLNPEEKDFAISVNGHTRSWEAIKAEVDKCILVCCRCHREIHDNGYLEKKHEQYKTETKIKREKPEIRHGSRVAYTYHKCRCEICRASNNEYTSSLRKRKSVGH